MNRRQEPSLVAFLLRHAALGFGGGSLLTLLLIALNIGGLRVLMTQSDSGWVGAMVLWISIGFTFAGLTSGAAVMQLGESEPPKPQGGMPIGLVPARIPVRVRARR